MRLSFRFPRGSQFRNLESWNLTDMIAAAVNLILVAAGIITFFQLLFGGLKFILAAGDKEKTHTATRQISHSLIGLIIVFATYALFGVLSEFLGVPLLQYTIISIN